MKASFNQSIVITCRSAQHLPKIHSVLYVDHLAEEVASLLSAGSDTESDAMLEGEYHILRMAGIFKKINEELLTAFLGIY